MQTAQTPEGVGIERAAVGVEAVRGDERHAAGKSDDDGGMIKIPRLPSQLYEIADLQIFHLRFFGERTRAAVGNEKPKEKFHARPGGGAVVRVDVKPAGHGGEIHDARAGVQALGGEIGAIAADAAEIVIGGAASERPSAGIGGCRAPIVGEEFEIVFARIHTVIVCAAAEKCRQRAVGKGRRPSADKLSARRSPARKRLTAAEKGDIIPVKTHKKEGKVMENKIVCNCKQVSVADIEKALHTHESFGDVNREFEEVQKLTHCSTGCGGCHDKILDVISELMDA